MNASTIQCQPRFEFRLKSVEVRAFPPFAKCAKDGAPKVCCESRVGHLPFFMKIL